MIDEWLIMGVILCLSLDVNHCFFVTLHILCSLQISDEGHKKHELCAVTDMDGEGWAYKLHVGVTTRDLIQYKDAILPV